jgi:phage baseplate assembly protein V
MGFGKRFPAVFSVDDIRRLMAPLHTRVVNMIARGIVKRVDDAKKAQVLQLGILADEVKDDVERLQNYGFTSVPLEGAEAVIVFPGGKRDHAVTVVTEDRRYRIRNLESGEVAVYDQTGSKIVLKANGDIEVTPSSGVTKLVGDLEVDGAITATGDIDSDGTVTGSSDVVGGGKSLKTHQHAFGTLTGSSSCSAGGASVTIAGSTAAPT